MPLLVGTWCGLFTTSIARIERIRVIRSFRRVSFHRGATQFGHPFPPLLMSSLSLHAFLPALVERTITQHPHLPPQEQKTRSPPSVTAMDRLPADVQIESILASLPYVYAVRDQWVVAHVQFLELSMRSRCRRTRHRSSARTRRAAVPNGCARGLTYITRITRTRRGNRALRFSVYPVAPLVAVAFSRSPFPIRRPPSCCIPVLNVPPAVPYRMSTE